jgi:hypothetical protein
VGDTAAITTVAVLALAPWVTLLFGAAVVPLSWVFYAGFPPALFTILLIHHGGVTRDWWRRLPPLRSLAWMGIAFVGLTLGGLAVAARPGPAVLPVVALTGFLNAWIWERAVRAVVLRVPALRRVPAPATVIALVALLVTVVGGSRIGFAAFEDDDAVAVAPMPQEAAGAAVLVVPGFASACCDDAAGFRAAAGGLIVEQFSYLGVDDGSRPVPHAGDATDGDLAVLASRMDLQVRELSVRVGNPISIVAESEGTLVVAAYLETYSDAPVTRLALLSPIEAPGRAEYPEPGAEGPGVVSGYQLRAMVALIDSLSPLPVSADGPLSTSLREHSEILTEGTIRDRPDIEELAVIPLADAVTAPPEGGYEVEAVVVAGFHGGLRGRSDVQELLIDWIGGGPVEGSPVLASLQRLIAAGAAPWQMPPLHDLPTTG